MTYRLTLTAALALSLGAASPVLAADGDAAKEAKSDSGKLETKTVNPFFAPSPLPFHFPQFDKIHNEDYKPAFEKGMRDSEAEILAIANNPEPATFENTIVAMERSGQLLTRVARVFFSQAGTNTNDAIQKLQAEMAPKLSAHTDKMVLNSKLFARIQAVYDQRDTLGLDAESKRLVERYRTDFVRAGAQLSDADKTKLKAMNSELASLSTQFSQNLLKETNASAIVVDKREQLAGLSDDAIAATSEAAKKRDLDGKFVIPLMNTTGQPSLASLKDRDLRERIMQASLNRGSHGGDFDNRAIVASVVKLRAERAALLGYPNHAAYVLEDETAGTVGAVNKLLAQLAPPAVANARAEAVDIQKVIDKEGGKFKVSAADWAYYTEKVRKEKYDLDAEQLRPYFEMNNVLEKGVFFAATKLYGITFKERKDLPLYLPDIRVFEVFEENGDPLALFIVDYYARSNKRGGAWANAYVAQSKLFGTKPVIANHLNVPKPPEGEPTLMTYDEVNTAFHEFGHALHGMFSNVTYPRFAGTSVPRDFVEYPSQVNEMWTAWPEVLKNYAKHYKTGEPLPKALLDKVKASEKFNQGFATTEYLGAALLDQAWHQITADQAPDADGVLAFEAAALKKAGVDYAPVPPRYRTTYFSHIMGGYSAGYYAYIWSEVLDADSVEWFKKNGGLTRKNGDHFRETLLSRGGSEDAMVLFRNFSGGEPYVQPLLERRGLTPKGK
ncbi:MAG TPA: M3 family metallopeptidase [Dokdonella sp.]|uniref:M3 family metallopeptidase n=1 Tax=Dokdonella sp. TaxID=2291710 RepID=UPI002D7EFC1B|nr:M3 family metallopeptidase [Dokdonella sp.]HET9032817.1 M3 family metallopeptidase [Dokdonella sp.]